MPKFFIVASPGFEAELDSEIKQFHALYGLDEGFKILSTQKGGIEFHSEFNESVYFNQYSRLATRMLVRWDEFHCVFFSDLEKKLKQKALVKWFKNKSRVFVKVNSKKSKLGQEKKIFEVFKRVYTDFELIPKASEAEENDFILYVDFFEDRCTLSIDTSGPALYKRSMDKKVSFGSMRETIAHWMYSKILTVDSPWKQPTILLDPYAGSGTLLLESQNAGLNKKRDYSFQKMKMFSDLKPLPETKEKAAIPPFSELIGIESDLEIFEILKSNTLGLSKQVSLTLENIDNENFKTKLSKRVWVVSNLPYGKQVKSESVKTMVNTMKTVLKPQLMALFHPEAINDKEAHSTLHFPITNGGLKVYLSVLSYKRP